MFVSARRKAKEPHRLPQLTFAVDIEASSGSRYLMPVDAEDAGH